MVAKQSTTSARDIVLESMKKDYKGLKARGPIYSRAFQDIKPSGAAIVAWDGLRTTEAKSCARILQASMAVSEEIHEQRLRHAATRIKRYLAGGEVLG